MAIGTTAAIIGSAVIGAGASILGSKSASKAASKAADAQAQGTAEAARVQEQMYNTNVQLQTPWMNGGLAAFNQVNALLGLGGGQATNGTAQGTQQYGQPVPVNNADALPAAYGRSNMLGQLYDSVVDRIRAGETVPQRTLERWNLADYAQQWRQAQQPQTPATPAAPANPQAAQDSANAAYDQFRNYTGYTTRLAEANRGLNADFAARGTIQSGAAMNEFGRQQQNFASNEFANYMGYLGNQQNIGAGATNALSGVSTQYGNNMANIAMTNGNNQASAAIARGNAQMGMIGGIGSALGGALGTLGGTSYGRF
jgi:hypothetical protein